MAVESMQRAAFQDIHRCLHRADDWDKPDDAEWDDVFLDNKYKSPASAKHRKSYALHLVRQ